MNPKITVLMPVFNAAKYLQEAINSILDQSFPDFEFLIVNDGSSDESEAIVTSYTDRRIRYLKNEQNLGIVATLNRGLTEAQGLYLARMDADDISLPDRLQLQNDYLDNHSEIVVVGTWIKAFGAANYIWRYPIGHEEIRATMLFESPLAHPTVMLRLNDLRVRGLSYRQEYIHAEDYDLWRLLIDQAKFANLPLVLLNYRVHAKSASQTRVVEQNSIATKIRDDILKKIGFREHEIKSDLHERIATFQMETTDVSFTEAAEWLGEIIKANHANGYYNASALDSIVSRRWYDLNNVVAGKRRFVFTQYQSLAKSFGIPQVSAPKRCRLLIKSYVALIKG